jgi:ubiquinone/menaquinone biosynthesis C-methylase UbiE
MTNNIGFKQEPQKYLASPRIKDYYERMYTELVKRNCTSVLDIGTASGDFLYFMPNFLTGTGIDSNELLISYASNSRKKDNIEFICASFESFKPDQEFDAITILGTLLCVDDFEIVLNKCLVLKPKLICINDFFNRQNVDIRLGYKRFGTSASSFNYAYNIVSISTIESYLRSKKLTWTFEKYEMTSTLFQEEDALSNYHAIFNGERILTNGLGLILHGYNLFIQP